MRLTIQIAVFALLLVAGVVLYPRPDHRVSPAKIVSQALCVEQASSIPLADVKRRLSSGCTPVLEGLETIDGADAWAVRLKIPPPKKYPWLELWIDKKTSSIVAFKEWGVRNGRVVVLSQFPESK